MKNTKEIPPAKSTLAADDRGTFMGLPGMNFIFVVVPTFVVINAFFNFPSAVLGAGVIYLCLFAWTVRKPRNYLWHQISFFFTHTVYNHRPYEGPLLTRNHPRQP